MLNPKAAPRRILSSVPLLLAATLAACGDDATSPPIPGFTAAETRAIGLSIAEEVENALAVIVPNELLGIDILEPALGAAARPASDPVSAAAITKPACATASENPILDDDEDEVPNDVTFTFATPACLFQIQNFTLSVTGSLRFIDPDSDTPDHSVDVDLIDFTLTGTGQGITTVLRRDGTMSASVTPNQIFLQQNIELTRTETGLPTTTVHSIWSATFVPTGTLTPGLPLPNGTFTPASSVTVTHGDQDLSFTLAAPTPLQYNALCAAEAESPFTAGELRATITSEQAQGYLQIRWSGCNGPSVVFVATS